MKAPQRLWRSWSPSAPEARNVLSSWRWRKCPCPSGRTAASTVWRRAVGAEEPKALLMSSFV
eukprot:6289816-Pyramimonas_sp.AAC.1